MLGCVAAGIAIVWALQSPPPSAADPPPIPDLHAPDVPVVTLAGASGDVTPSSGQETGPVLVHVAGAVVDPGVHELSAGDRVVTALAAAGGPLDDAHLDALNLAAPVADGQWIYVPVVGVDPPPPPTGGAPTLEVDVEPVDVNRAPPTELERLPGIGPALAAAIVADREQHGPFGSVDELIRVRGIGPAKLDALRDLAVI